MIVNVSIFVLKVCTSAWDECGVGWAVCGGWVGGGGACNFFQNAAIVSKIEQCRAVILTFQSINYLLCTYLCLQRLKKKKNTAVLKTETLTKAPTRLS